MSRIGRMNPTMLLAFGCLAMAGTAALAQPATSPQPAGASHAPAAAFQANETNESLPVFAITSVEILRGKTQPAISVVAVRGVTSTEGWGDAELIPIGNGTPPDGVLDLVLVAHPPPESAAPTAYAPIHAVLPLSTDHPFRAVRVRGATNALQLRGMQSIVETKPPVEACSQCVGRYFIVRGGGLPAGVGADQVVREEDLPANARIIRATDGISDTRRDSNRLTILLGDDGQSSIPSGNSDH